MLLTESVEIAKQEIQAVLAPLGHVGRHKAICRLGKDVERAAEPMSRAYARGDAAEGSRLEAELRAVEGRYYAALELYPDDSPVGRD